VDIGRSFVGGGNRLSLRQTFFLTAAPVSTCCTPSRDGCSRRPGPPGRTCSRRPLPRRKPGRRPGGARGPAVQGDDAGAGRRAPGDRRVRHAPARGLRGLVSARRRAGERVLPSALSRPRTVVTMSNEGTPTVSAMCASCWPRKRQRTAAENARARRRRTCSAIPRARVAPSSPNTGGFRCLWSSGVLLSLCPAPVVGGFRGGGGPLGDVRGVGGGALISTVREDLALAEVAWLTDRLLTHGHLIPDGLAVLLRAFKRALREPDHSVLGG
jgi:hypothetical protein